MYNSFQNISDIKLHATKPNNPIEGDTYYDTKNNRVYTFSKGSWVMYQLYIGDKAEKRIEKINKIKNLLK